MKSKNRLYIAASGKQRDAGEPLAVSFCLSRIPYYLRKAFLKLNSLPCRKALVKGMLFLLDFRYIIR